MKRRVWLPRNNGIEHDRIATLCAHRSTFPFQLTSFLKVILTFAENAEPEVDALFPEAGPLYNTTVAAHPSPTPRPCAWTSRF
jgi:hypothetical protein